MTPAFLDPVRRPVVVDVLGVLADLTRQRQGWLVAGDLASPTELCCTLLDDMQVAEFADGAEQHGMPELHAVFRQMVREFESVDLDVAPRDLLQDPAWQRIASLAADALRHLGGAVGSTAADAESAALQGSRSAGAVRLPAREAERGWFARVRRGWLRLRGGRWGGRVRLRGDAGFTIERVSRSGRLVETVAELRWEQVRRVRAYKVDLSVVDSICLAFEAADRHVVVDERFEGFDALARALEDRLPGCREWASWWPEVAFPAFAENLTLLWEAGSDAPRADPS